MGEPDVGLVLQSNAAAKQSQTHRSGTDTEVECEGLAGVVSLVVEGIELRLRLKLAGLIDHSKVKTSMVLPVFLRVKLDSDMSNSFRFQYEKKERKEISDEKDFTTNYNGIYVSQPVHAQQPGVLLLHHD